MSYEDWQRVTEEFSKLREMPPELRGAYLESMESALAAAVRPLLEADDAMREDPASDFLESPFAAAASVERHGPLPPTLGAEFGPYKIQEQIGHGGMGRVYLAERSDGAYEQKVAVKVLSSDLLDASAIRRFELERQILADLRHPNIARFFGGGTLADGRPFLVMEYVDGVAIDTYCDREALDLAARIRLVLAVCGAVQAAHELLIVHRDIKPANLLIDARGEPRLVDFGIAKSLRETPDESTTTLDRHLTPSYASPEHLLGQPVGVASDVYSLGVVLYLLVAGARPYEISLLTTREAVAEALEQEPLAPSQPARRRWRRLARRDRQRLAELDHVILQAIARDSSHRYGTVRELMDDLERALSGEPVLAGRPPRWRRARAWMRRHPVATAVAAACGIWASVLLVGFQIHSSRLSAQAAQAQYFTQRASEVAAIGRLVAFLPREAVEVDPQQMLVVRSEQIRQELQSARGLARPAAHYALGQALLSLRRLEEAREALETAWAEGLQYPGVALALGEVYGRLYRQGLDELRRLEGGTRDEERRQQLVRELRDPARHYLRLGNSSSAEPRAYVRDYVLGQVAFFDDRLDSAAELAAAAYGRAPWLYEARILAADILLRRAEIAGEDSRLDEHLEMLAAARRAYRQVNELVPRAAEAVYGECETWLRQVDAIKALQQVSRDTIEASQIACRAGLDQAASNIRARQQLATLYSYLAWNQEIFGELDGAKSLETAIEQARQAVEMDPANPTALNILGSVLVQQARTVLNEGGQPEPLLSEAERVFSEAAREAPQSLSTRLGFGLGALITASWRETTGRDARSAFELAVSRLREAAEKNPDSALAIGNLGTAESMLAAELGASDEARFHFHNAARHLRRASQLDPQNLVWVNNLASLLIRRVRFEILAGGGFQSHLDQAEELFRSLLETHPKLKIPPFHLAVVYTLRAEIDLYAASDPSTNLHRAREYAQIAEDAGFRSFDLPFQRAEIEWLAARHRVDMGHDPQAALAAAEAHIAQAESLDATPSGRVALIRAEVEWLKAKCTAPGSAAWKDAMDATGHWLEAAIDRNPRLAQALMLRGELQRELCQIAGGGGCDAAAEDWARQAEGQMPGVHRLAARWR